MNSVSQGAERPEHSTGRRSCLDALCRTGAKADVGAYRRDQLVQQLGRPIWPCGSSA